MQHTHRCPKCGGGNTVRVPDNPHRHASGNNIYTTTMTLMGKIPVIRYVCCDCGYVENWVETGAEREKLRRTFGRVSDRRGHRINRGTSLDKRAQRCGAK